MRDPDIVLSVPAWTAICVGFKMFFNGLWNLLLGRDVILEVEHEDE